MGTYHRKTITIIKINMPYYILMWIILKPPKRLIVKTWSR